MTVPTQNWQIARHNEEKLYWWSVIANKVEVIKAVEAAGGREGWILYTLGENHLDLELDRFGEDGYTITEI